MVTRGEKAKQKTPLEEKGEGRRIQKKGIHQARGQRLESIRQGAGVGINRRRM